MRLLRKLSFVFILILTLFISHNFAGAQEGYAGDKEIVIDGVTYKKTETEFQKIEPVNGSTYNNLDNAYNNDLDIIPFVDIPGYEDIYDYIKSGTLPSLDGQSVAPSIVCEDVSGANCYNIDIPGTAIGEPVYGEFFGESDLWQKVEYDGVAYYVPVDRLYDGSLEVDEVGADINTNGVPINKATYSISEGFNKLDATNNKHSPFNVNYEQGLKTLQSDEAKGFFAKHGGTVIKGGRELAGVGVGFVPIAGDLYDFGVAFAGYDPITGEKLDWVDRGLTALAIVPIPFVTGKTLRLAKKGVQLTAKRYGKTIKGVAKKYGPMVANKAKKFIAEQTAESIKLAKNTLNGTKSFFKKGWGKVFRKSNPNELVDVVHRGSTESILGKIRKKVLPANYPVPNTPLMRGLEHSNPAIWVSEGKPSAWNRLWSGMVGKRGEASISLKVKRSDIKKPDGLIKSFFGKSQRVIENDVPIPKNTHIELPGYNSAQTKNLIRFESKIPKKANPTKLYELPNGGKAFQAKVPSNNIPGSYAVYEKQIDKLGKTREFTKTTYDETGSIFHIKDKIRNLFFKN